MDTRSLQWVKKLFLFNCFRRGTRSTTSSSSSGVSADLGSPSRTPIELWVSPYHPCWSLGRFPAVEQGRWVTQKEPQLFKLIEQPFVSRLTLPSPLASLGGTGEQEEEEEWKRWKWNQVDGLSKCPLTATDDNYWSSEYIWNMALDVYSTRQEGLEKQKKRRGRRTLAIRRRKTSAAIKTRRKSVYQPYKRL